MHLANIPRSRPETAAADAISPSEQQHQDENRRGREEKAFNETLERIQMIQNRESASIRLNEECRKESGWFGAVHRFITTSDPYAIEAKNSRRILAAAEYAKSLVVQARSEADAQKKTELLNQARRLSGLREIEPGTFAVSKRAPVTAGLNQANSDTRHFTVEQETISTSRDVVFAAAATAATLGVGAVSGALAKGGQTALTAAARFGVGARAAGVVTAELSAASGYDDVSNGLKTAPQAVRDGLVMTAASAGTGGLLGVVLPPVVGRLSARTPRVQSSAGSAADDGLRVNGPEIQKILKAPTLAEQEAAAANGLRVNGPEIRQILEAPPLGSAAAQTAPAVVQPAAAASAAQGPYTAAQPQAAGRATVFNSASPSTATAQPAAPAKSSPPAFVAGPPGGRAGAPGGGTIAPTGPAGGRAAIAADQFENMFANDALVARSGLSTEDLRREGLARLYQMASEETSRMASEPAGRGWMREVLRAAFERFVSEYPQAAFPRYWY